MWKWKSKMISNKCWNAVNCFFLVNVWRKKIITKIRSQYYVLFQTNIDVEVPNGKMIYFQDWKQGVKSCSWFPKKEKGVRRSDCERLPKFCRRAISTLLQFLDTLFLIAASSIFIVTTYCTNIFDRNYIAFFSGGWGFLLEINLFTDNNRSDGSQNLGFQTDLLTHFS